MDRQHQADDGLRLGEAHDHIPSVERFLCHIGRIESRSRDDDPEQHTACTDELVNERVYRAEQPSSRRPVRVCTCSTISMLMEPMKTNPSAPRAAMVDPCTSSSHQSRSVPFPGDRETQAEF